MSLFLALFFLLIIGFMVVGGVQAIRQPRVASDRMAEAGRLLGFAVDIDTQLQLYPKITGEREGLRVEVWVEYPNTDDPSTFYEIRFPAHAAPAFAITTRSRFTASIRKRDEMPEITYGDTPFDKAVRIRGMDRAALYRFLTPTRQRAVSALLEHWKKIEVTHESLLVQSGEAVPKDPKEIVRNVDELVAVAKLLKANPPQGGDR